LSEQDPPKIEFPCLDYPVKIIGDACDHFIETVAMVVEQHAPGYDRAKMNVKHSGKGNYTSITVHITATGVDQLESLHLALKRTGIVRMVL